MRPLPLALCRLVALCCLIALTGCAKPVVRKDILAPAQAAEVARLTRLRVLPFDNDPGGGVRAAVEHALASVTVEGRPYFTIIGVDAAAAKGMPMQWSDPAKPKAKPIRYGAEGSVQASVDQNAWRDERSTEYRRECVYEDDKGRCLAWGKRPVACVRRTARFSFTPRVVARDSGVVLFAQEFAESETSSACLDRGAPTDGQALLASASRKAVARFRDQVAPHVVSLAIPLLTEDDSGMSAQTKVLVSGGVEYAQAGQTDKACRLWRSASEGHAAGFALPYLRGVCAELADRLDEAEALYLQAGQRSGAPVPEIAAALARVRSTRAGQEKLESQLK